MTFEPPFSITPHATTQELPQETTQEKILRLLRSRPEITRRELAAAVGITADGGKTKTY